MPLLTFEEVDNVGKTYDEILKRSDASGVPGKQLSPKRKKARKRKAQPAGDASAHPSSSSYDPEHAQTIMGDLAEEVRSWLADKHDARPPGLQTVQNDDGTLTVIADNPESGLGMEVLIGPLKGEEVPPQVPGAEMPPEMAPEAMAQPGFGVGPEMMAPQPAAPVQSMAPPQPQPGFGVGPTF